MVLGHVSKFIENFEEQDLTKMNMDTAYEYIKRGMTIPQLPTANVNPTPSLSMKMNNANNNKQYNPARSMPMPSVAAMQSMGGTMPSVGQTMVGTMPSIPATQPQAMSLASSIPVPSATMTFPTMPSVGQTMPSVGQTMPSVGQTMPTVGQTMQQMGGKNMLSPEQQQAVMSMPSTTPSMAVEKMRDIKKSNKNKFANIENKVENEVEDDEDMEEEEEDEEMPMYNKKKELEEDEKSELDEEDEDVEEGFQGSRVVDMLHLKNILLALLVTLIGVSIAYSYNKNLIPLSNELRKYKMFIYGGLFFLVSYMCVEIF